MIVNSAASCPFLALLQRADADFQDGGDNPGEVSHLLTSPATSMPRFLQKFRAADARRHSLGLLTQTDRLLCQAVLERLFAFGGWLSWHDDAPLQG
jgi:hypothetical protein